MSDDSFTSWPEANERYLMATVDVLREVLKSHAARLAGRELEDRSAAHGDAKRAYPTFELALDMLPGAHRSALSPDGSLRRWRLIEVGVGDALVSSPLRLAERVLHFLFGVEHLDERLARLLETAPVGGELAPSHLALAERLAAVWAPVEDAADFPAVHLRCQPNRRGSAGRQLGLYPSNVPSLRSRCWRCRLNELGLQNDRKSTDLRGT